MEFPYSLITAVILILSVLGFSMMGIDKGRARKGRWRISEKALLLVALLGGSPGVLIGMRCFRHKTRHWYFRYGVPVVLALQAALILTLAYWNTALR